METVSAVFKINKRTKAKNAKLDPARKVRLLIKTVRYNVPKSVIPGSTLKDGSSWLFISLNACIGSHVYINTEGKAAVDVKMFNKAEKVFIVDVCRALGFNPRW